MSHTPLRFRQVHMDFHTSADVQGIGADFDPETFAATLAEARVNSVTVFARCHHGWIYYPSRTNPERVHPHLSRENLLGEQIEACHKRDIRCPIYLTVQWDAFSFERHPEWACMDSECKHPGPGFYEPGFYNTLCVNSGYRQFLAEHVREILQTLPVDGLFFDIVQPVDCSCPNCRRDMARAGVKMDEKDQRMAFAVEMLHAWKQEMSALVREQVPEATIFYNAGHIGPRVAKARESYSHWELESLPSGGWGYMHFPLTQRYARTTGLPQLGMTGKFHTAWGNFHSFKNPPALEFECFQMLALAAGCSVGDQLPPTGRICEHTYELIGSVYKQVEAKEPWCEGAEAVCDIAVLNPEAFDLTAGHGDLTGSARGAVRLLQEGRHQFDLVDTDRDLSAYRLVVLPDNIPVSAELAGKLTAFVDGGGAILATDRSGLTPGGDAFALDALGVDYFGPAHYSPDYVVPSGQIGRGLPETEHCMYLPGREVRPRKGAKVLSWVHKPYFNRTWEHYFSHRNTPSSGEKVYPAAVQNGRCIYFAHPLFQQYDDNAALWSKKLALNAVDLLLAEPLIRVCGPSSLIATVNAQPQHKRRIVHLLFYVPERRGQAFDTIEDVYPLADVAVSLRADGEVKKVTLVPSGEALEFAETDGRIEFTVPKLLGHQMISVE
jgi:hypothetical protein